MIALNNDDYSKEWKTIDSLERKGLPRSAFEQVEALYAKAQKDENAPQVIKCLMYWSKYNTQLEEDGLAKSIGFLNQELENAAFPVKPVLQSVVASIYAQYLQSNLWQLRDRTSLGDFKPDDLQTWTIELLVKEARALYLASLEEERTKQINIQEFAAITTKPDNVEGLRPTLYDFLAHRAIDYLRDERSYLSDPSYKFYIDDPKALAPAKDFATHTFESQQEDAPHFKTLLILQDLINFHQDDKDPAALIDADLKRLQFVHDNCIIEEKDQRFLNALEAIERRYTDHPSRAEVAYYKALYYFQKGQKYQPNPEDTGKWDLKEAHEICTAAIKAYPDSYGAQNCKSLITKIASKELSLNVEEVNVPGKPFLGFVEYKNIKKVYLKVIKLDEKAQDKIDKMRRRDYMDFFNSLKPQKVWSVDLPNDGDFHKHSTEIKFDELGFGLYLILISNNDQFSDQNNATGFAFTHISTLAYWSRTASDGALEFFVMDRRSGEPIEGAKAEFFKRNYNSILKLNEWSKVGTFESDKEGYINAQVKSDRSVQARFSRGEDILRLNHTYYSYSNRNRQRNSVQKTHFFLDRAIYRPGQTIYFKGIVVELDEERMPSILPNKRVKVTLYDVNHQEVESKQLVTNEYGTINGSFIAPRGGLVGRMSIYSDVGNASKSFRVEEYKRPKFEASFKPIEGSFKLDEEVTVTGLAKAYAGNVIDGGKVQYRVVREVRFPYWRWSRWFWPPYTEEKMEIAYGETTTNSQGEFEITFTAIPDRTIDAEKKPEFYYKIYADVTDITGETHATTTSVTVGYVALNVSVPLEDQINKGEFNELEISTKNLNGQFEPAAGTVKIEQLQMPDRVFYDRYWDEPDQYVLSKETYQKEFPHFAYQRENEWITWKPEKTVFESDFDTEKKKTLEVKSNSWKAGKYLLTLQTKDNYGTSVEYKSYFTLYDLKSKKVPVNQPFFALQEQSQWQPGETALGYFGTAEKEGMLLLEVEHEEEVIDRKWMELNQLEAFQFAVEEKHRGNVFYHLNMVKNNRTFNQSQTISVPWTNKELEIEYATFRDKLYPGQEEEWTLKVMGPKKEKVAAEMVAAMYDASLDAFVANKWYLNLFPVNYSRKRLSPKGFGRSQAQLMAYDWNTFSPAGRKAYRSLNYFGFYPSSRSYYYQDYDTYGVDTARPRADVRNKKEAAPAMAEMGRNEDDQFANGLVTDAVVNLEESEGGGGEEPVDEKPVDFGDVSVRTNLDETVFFFPQLKTDADGNVLIKFTMNEALTRWKFLGLAHTKDLKTGITENEVVTQKDLMVMPNPPRFMREGDEIEYTAKVSNLTEEDMKGTAKLELFDATTMKPVDQLMGLEKAEIAFTAPAGQSAALSWKLTVPVGKVPALTHRVVAKAGNFSDGEESALPILSNRMLVTETKPLPMRGNETKTFTLESLKNSNSNTLTHHQFSLEFTSNPAWYAVQALPYLMEYPYECTEQIFNRFYANTLASTFANAHPRIRQVFDQWKNVPEDQPSSAFVSNLAKNQDLKSAILEETPWVLASQSEEQQKKNIALLFDLNRMADEQAIALAKMEERQLGSGGFAWFPGGRDNWYITQYIVEGLGHLDRLGAKELEEDQGAKRMVNKAISYTDRKILEEYKELEYRVKKGQTKWEDDHLGYLEIHYLYARSFFQQEQMGGENQKVLEYYLDQAEKHWLNKNTYMQGMLALALKRYNREGTPTDIVKSLKERSINNEELGRYWKSQSGYFWYQHPIETQALMIEVFDEVGQDAATVEELKIWLLKNKQTNHWKTTKATSSATYALLMNGDNWLLEDQPVQITLGKQKIDTENRYKEAGTGYFKIDWNGSEVSKEMAKIKVTNPNKVVSWGAVYWQYFEDLDKIKTFEETPLTLKKQLFKEVNTDTGPELQAIEEAGLEPGDKIKVRIELRVDRPMEYVHMKDMRASGFEPMNVFSQYKWQGGLGYYESTRDASTNFFFDYLPRGTYVFEYPLRVIHKGDFSNGITTIQSMYAPEFSSHSEGVRVEVD